MLPEPVWRKRLEIETDIMGRYPLFRAESSDFTEWEGSIIGRGYYKGEHRVKITLTRMFPFEPPQIEWLTPIFHPNIEPPKSEGSLGRICVEFVNDKWTPQAHLNGVIEALSYMLHNPNPDDPLADDTCQDAATFFKKFLKEHPNLANVNKAEI